MQQHWLELFRHSLYFGVGLLLKLEKVVYAVTLAKASNSRVRHTFGNVCNMFFWSLLYWHSLPQQCSKCIVMTFIPSNFYLKIYFASTQGLSPEISVHKYSEHSDIECWLNIFQEGEKRRRFVFREKKTFLSDQSPITVYPYH